MRKIILATLVLFISLSSCDDSDDFEQISKKEEIRSILKDNNYTNIEFDINIKTSESLKFNSIVEFKEFVKQSNLEKMKKNASLTHHSEEDDIGGGGSGDPSRVKINVYDYFYFGFGSHIVVEFNLKPGCVASNINSYLRGFTVGTSYSHTGGETYTSVSDDRLYWRVDGLVTFTMSAEGINFRYTVDDWWNGVHYCD